MVKLAYFLRFKRELQEDNEFEVNMDNMLGSKPAQTTQWDPISEKKEAKQNTHTKKQTKNKKYQ